MASICTCGSRSSLRLQHGRRLEARRARQPYRSAAAAGFILFPAVTIGRALLSVRKSLGGPRSPAPSLLLVVIASLISGAQPLMASAQTRALHSTLPLELLEDTLAVCRLPSNASTPSWALSGGTFLTVSRTPEELSITTDQRLVPPGVECERDYRAFRVRGPLPLNLIGILASLAVPLAEARISIFAISTYETDYVLVKERDLKQAVAALERAGHTVTRGGS